MPYLSRVSNSIERSEMAHKVAEKLVIDDPLVRSELQRAVRERRSQLQKNVTDRGTRLIPAEIQVLQSVFGSENLATELLSFCQSASYYCGLASERIFEAVLSVLKEGGLLEPDGVITRLTEESDREMFMRILYENVEPLTHDHFVNCLDALKRHYLEREKVTLQNQIRDAESRRDVVQLQELLRNQQKLTRQLADLSR